MSNLSEICFPVYAVESNKLIKTSGQGKVITTSKNLSRSIVVDASEGIQIVNFASPKYELVKNVDLYTGVEQALKDARVDFSANYINKDNSLFYGDYVLKGAEFKIAKARNAKGDSISPKIRIGNSYDSSIKLNINFGFYREICTNGLHGIKYEQKKFKHTTNIELFVAQIPALIEQYLNDAEILVNKYFEVLSDKMVRSYEDRVIEVINAVGLFKVEKSEKNPAYSSSTEYCLNMALTESAQLGMPVNNDWIVYNAINSFIFNEEMNGKTEQERMGLDSKVMSYLMSN